ncbi:FAD-dependent oxidoreductase [Promethearchaeum syntrophicum]|uniref:formate dehydrogenase (coenzyme F420) n=1 Tax=Promethearchaeum syntrophicum TaxID=2594042 RepID=A0A5B9D8J5_9ARCH|nr:FAD-dependent oxidoreductase [Candidatus Prometheoarchaeum syntrophicum]QEE15325.1 Sulfide dehydrogenase subunit alpha precursor [Candidatus Prometheoarchaeum syntrophicum]
MSFELLKMEIIDAGLCQGCGLCAGLCKHIEMVDLKPAIVDYCIVTKEGLACGKCYDQCPQITQKQLKVKESPIDIVALKTADEKILEKAASGGFVTTLNKYLLDTKKVTQLIEVRDLGGIPEGEITTDPTKVHQYAGVAYGRSGSLQKLVEVLGVEHGQIGIVGVPCEIRGAAELEKQNKADIFKIGLFCNANIRSGERDDNGVVFSPCRRMCPAGVDASGYVNYIRQGKFQEAVDLIRDMNPLPSVCGRVCTHECEYNCTLIGTNHPIAIRELKKFVTEWEMDLEKKNWKNPKKEENAKKVAIIGSGPSGLSCAYYLANKGYRPTIFEKTDKLGGMLRFGIPKFRLPDEVLDYDIEFIKSAGVEFKLNSPIGPNLTFNDLKKQGYEAFYVSLGQYKPNTLHLPGEDLENVHMAIDFLMKRKYRHWENLDEFKDKTIGIVGGGPVAVDVAQTALRLGAKKIILIDIQNEKALTMVIADIPENEYKFMEYKFNTSTSKLTQEGDKIRFHSHKIKIDTTDGKFKLDKIEGTEFTFDVDSVVMAVGQSVDFTEFDKALSQEIKKVRGKILVDELTFETNVPGIFAGGDIVVRGKNVAVAAIAHGREAAESIKRYLKNQDMTKGRMDRTTMFFHGALSAPEDVSQKPPLEVPVDETWTNFEEFEGKFTKEMAMNEANRCFTCNYYCTHCQDFGAIHADLTAGDIGSDKDFTTVVIWTKKGYRVVQDMIKKGLVIEGPVQKEAVDLAIDKKMKRKLIEHAKTPREKIEQWIKLNGSATIPKLSEILDMPVTNTRYNALRLAQEKKLSMEIIDGNPVFSIMVEEM